MNNSDNLIPNSARTPQELKEMTRKGGIASGKARREKKYIQEALKKALGGKYNLEDENREVGGYEALAISMIKQALKGNVNAFNSIRDTIGEKPEDKVSIENENLQGINIEFVDKSNRDKHKEIEPIIIGDYTPPTETEK